MKAILIISAKGGTGKTTIATTLAKILAMDKKTLLLDADISLPNVTIQLDIPEDARITVNQGWYYPVKYDNNLSVLSMSFIIPPKIALSLDGVKRASLIREFITNLALDDDLEYMVIDSPPGMSDEILAVIENLNGVCDKLGIIIVVIGKRESIADAQRAVSMLKSIPFEAPIIGLVKNMAFITCSECRNKIPLFDDGLNIEDELGHRILDSLPYKNPLSTDDFKTIKREIEIFFSEEVNKEKEDGS